MAKVFIEETTLTAIGDAIRGKTGKTELIDPVNMGTEIASIETGGGDVEISDVVISGNAQYACAGAIAGTFIELYPTKVTTKNLTELSYMFYNYTGSYIPFDLNVSSSSRTTSMFSDASNLKATPAIDCKHTTPQAMSYMFNYCGSLTDVGPVTNAYPDSIENMFNMCKRLRELPDNFFDTWDFSRLLEYSYANLASVFSGCYSLRALPKSFFEKLSPGPKSGFAFYCHLYNLGHNCTVMDEMTDIPLIHESITMTSDIFYQAFSGASRMKRITFATNEDGTPKVCKWYSQYLNLCNELGWVNEYANKIDNYNSGITYATRVTDDASYQALKNDPDWWTTDVAYSRYNHDSAVETINSLPDTSGGTNNVILFKSGAGSRTDGGAINTLTEEEIAVAAAKGWTVTFAD